MSSHETPSALNPYRSLGIERMGMPPLEDLESVSEPVTGHSISSRVRPSWLLAPLLLIVVALVFGAVRQYGFVAWDDDLHVSGNPRFQPVTWSQVGAFWRAPYEHLYMPVTYSAWAALAWLSTRLIPGPLKAEFFHCFNLLLHLGNVLLVYRIALLILGENRTAGEGRSVPPAAAAAALLFGLHPLQVEAVAWVSGLKDVFSACWALIAVWQYLEFVQTQNKRVRRWGHYAMSTLAFCLALLTKPVSVMVPVVAGVLAVGGLGQGYGKTAWTLSGWLLVAGVWGIFAKGLQPDAVLGFVTPWWGRPLVAADAIAFYLGKFVWPVGLGPDYGRTPQVVLGYGWKNLTALVPLGLGLLLWNRRRRLKGLVLAARTFTVALFPALGLVPFIFQAYSTVADRYVYLALLGPALGFGWLLRHAAQRRAWWLAAALWLSLLGWRSTTQVQVWHDTISLFSHALRINPDSALAHNNLGWTFSQQGDLKKAVWHYKRALQLRPTMLEAGYNLGDALAGQGKLEDAIAHYTWVLKFRPDWADAHNNLGTALMRHGDTDQAVKHYTQAIRLKPGWALPYNNMGDAMAREGKTAAALNWFTHAMQRKPEMPEAPYNLGSILWQEGRIQEAIPAYREALRRRPDWPQAANNLAWLLTLQDTPSDQDRIEAVRLAEQACQATDYRNPIALRTLAAAYHAVGDQETAIRAAGRALAAARASGDTALAAKILEQLQDYEKHHATPTHH